MEQDRLEQAPAQAGEREWAAAQDVAVWADSAWEPEVVAYARTAARRLLTNVAPPATS